MPRPRGLDAAAKKLMQAKAGLKRLQVVVAVGGRGTGKALAIR